jgi:hypothetical protein
VVVLMDTTYWGRKFGVVTLKDNKTKVVLWRKFVKYETLTDYKEGVLIGFYPMVLRFKALYVMDFEACFNYLLIIKSRWVNTIKLTL